MLLTLVAQTPMAGAHQNYNVDGKVLEAGDAHELGQAAVHPSPACQAAPHVINHQLDLHTHPLPWVQLLDYLAGEARHDQSMWYA